MQKGWGLGWDSGLENWGGVGGWGQGSEVITAAFLDKGPLPLPSTCSLIDADVASFCDGVDLDTTPTATGTKAHWPLGSRPVQTSSAASMVAGAPQWHKLTPRPPPICLPPPHAWPFYRLCLNRGFWSHPWWLLLTPHGVDFSSSMPMKRMCYFDTKERSGKPNFSIDKLISEAGCYNDTMRRYGARQTCQIHCKIGTLLLCSPIADYMCV